jgi:hypothetical protein
MSVPKPATVSIDHNILEGIEMETAKPFVPPDCMSGRYSPAEGADTPRG